MVVGAGWSDEDRATFRHHLAVGLLAMLWCLPNLPLVKNILGDVPVLVLNGIGCLIGAWVFGAASFYRSKKGRLRHRGSFILCVIMVAFAALLVMKAVGR